MANTGGGAGGGNGINGGSGIVIIRYPTQFPTLSSIGNGLSYNYAVSGGFRYYAFTAGTGTVKF
jgi:hypothetical protein